MSRQHRRHLSPIAKTVNPVLVVTIATVAAIFALPGAAGELEIRVVEEGTGQVIPARVEITDPRGRHPHPQRLPFWKQQFTTDGPFVLRLGPGTYAHRIERGPEYHGLFGTFVMSADATDNKIVELKRHIEMRAHGWWSGDPWVERKPEHLPMLVVGEDLHLAANVATEADTATDSGNRIQPVVMDRVVDRTPTAVIGPGGRLHFRSNDNQIDTKQTTFAQLRAAARATHIQIVQPAAWDTPAWLATERVDSMVVLRPDLRRSAESPGGRPRDEIRFPGSAGSGRYREHIYYQALNAGLQIAPAAATASGLSEEHPGTHRTYVQLPGGFDADQWWQGLEAGRTVITNGPLMLPTVNEQLPGHVFHIAKGASLELHTNLTLHTRVKIDYLEFIQNGASVAELRLDKWAESDGKLPVIRFAESGWMLVRAVTNSGQSYQYASTAPFYVQVDGRPRISRQAVQFFRVWLYQAAGRLQQLDEAHRQSLLPYYRYARTFWNQRLEQANVE